MSWWPSSSAILALALASGCDPVWMHTYLIEPTAVRVHQDPGAADLAKTALPDIDPALAPACDAIVAIVEELAFDRGFRTAERAEEASEPRSDDPKTLACFTRRAPEHARYHWDYAVVVLERRHRRVRLRIEIVHQPISGPSAAGAGLAYDLKQRLLAEQARALLGEWASY